MNGDGVVDLYDILSVSGHFNETWTARSSEGHTR